GYGQRGRDRRPAAPAGSTRNPQGARAGRRQGGRHGAHRRLRDGMGVSRLGILGGTFDPIHYGHLAAAEEAAWAFQLDRVLFIPARQPPHKRGEPVTPAKHRLEMVQLAIEGNDRFELSTIELERAGPSYTVDTL